MSTKTVIMKSPTSVFYVLPSASLRTLCVRNAKRLLPNCNYAIQWRDKHGFGLELAVADWVPAGCFYFNP